jgi:hypothetical protein
MAGALWTVSEQGCLSHALVVNHVKESVKATNSSDWQLLQNAQRFFCKEHYFHGLTEKWQETKTEIVGCATI